MIAVLTGGLADGWLYEVSDITTLLYLTMVDEVPRTPSADTGPATKSLMNRSHGKWQGYRRSPLDAWTISCNRDGRTTVEQFARFEVTETATSLRPRPRGYRSLTPPPALDADITEYLSPLKADRSNEELIRMRQLLRQAGYRHETTNALLTGRYSRRDTDKIPHQPADQRSPAALDLCVQQSGAQRVAAHGD